MNAVRILSESACANQLKNALMEKLRSGSEHPERKQQKKLRSQGKKVEKLGSEKRKE